MVHQFVEIAVNKQLVFFQICSYALLQFMANPLIMKQIKSRQSRRLLFNEFCSNVALKPIPEIKRCKAIAPLLLLREV
jgi:hypothetical protein